MSFYTDAVMADLPLAYWRLGESAGTVAHDATNNGNHGAIIGSPTFGIVGPVLGDPNTGMTFHPGGSISALSGVNVGPQFSVEAWYQGGSGSTFRTIARRNWVQNPDGWDLFLTNVSPWQPFFALSQGSTQYGANSGAGTITDDGNWHHFVGTYDGQAVRIYVDGVLKTSHSQANLTSGFTGAISIAPATGSDSVTVDEVAVYNSALSASRILAHYQAASIAPTGAGTWAAPVSPYTYRVADLMTGNMLAELPLKSVSFSSKLNDSGSFSAELPLSDPTLVLPKDPIGSTQPGRTAVWIDRAGVLVWGGILWTRKYNSAREVLSLGAQDFLSYFDHRYITDTLTYTNVDQLSIAEQVLQNLTGKSGSWNALQYASPYPTSPILRTQSYNSYEFKQASQALQDLSQADNGFDFGFDVGYASGVPVVTFNPAYPRRGRSFSASGFVLELPGGVVSYDYSEDGTQIAVTDHVVGSGAGMSQLTSSSSTPSLLDAGYPLIEAVFSYKGQTDQGTLDQVAIAETKAYAGPVATFDLVALASYLSPGSFISGDDVRLRITDKRFNLGRNADGSLIGPGLDAFKRIFSYEVTPGDDTAETIRFTLGAVPA